MTAADDELTALRARCGPHLARLALLAGSHARYAAAGRDGR